MREWMAGIWQRFRAPAEAGPAAARRGRRGEQLAERWLIKELGWSTVSRNWRAGHGEIDLIMRGPVGQLVFVEVRGRSAHAKVGGYHSVTAKKRKILRRTVLAYLHRLRGPPPPWRFDIVEIVWHASSGPEIRHHPHAQL